MSKDKPKVIRKARTQESFVREQSKKDPKHWTPEYRMWMARQMAKKS